MRYELNRFIFMQVGGGAAGTATAPVGDIHQPAAVAEPAVEWPEQGQDLPEQMGGTRSLLMPGIYTFQLPKNLAQLWHDIVAQDKRQTLSDGRPNPTYGQHVKRKQLKFDRNNPLVVLGGPMDGAPMIASFSTAPRARGKADDPKTPWISDASYMLDISLNDKSRPSDPEKLKAAINQYAGKTVRIETGLTGQCRPDRVRYIRVVTDQAAYLKDNTKGIEDIADPTGKKGCGQRYYTSNFKDGKGGFVKEIGCACGTPTPAEAAAGMQPATVVIRAFEQVERFLPPQG